jgi:hypothetical protein
MKTTKQLLHDADPLRHEPPISSTRRDALRQAVVAAASSTTPGPSRVRFLLVRVAAVSIAAIVILVLGSRMWPRMGFETHAAVRFEVRLAEYSPAPGLREVKVPGSNRSIYLHPEIVVGNGDIERAEVLPGRDAGQFVVGIIFTPDGTRKMLAATQNHIGRPVAILVDDEVVMAPTVRAAIGERAEINGNYTREEAERVVNGIQ